MINKERCRMFKIRVGKVFKVEDVSFFHFFNENNDRILINLNTGRSLKIYNAQFLALYKNSDIWKARKVVKVSTFSELLNNIHTDAYFLIPKTVVTNNWDGFRQCKMINRFHYELVD